MEFVWMESAVLRDVILVMLLVLSVFRVRMELIDS